MRTASGQYGKVPLSNHGIVHDSSSTAFVRVLLSMVRASSSAIPAASDGPIFQGGQPNGRYAKQPCNARARLGSSVGFEVGQDAHVQDLSAGQNGQPPRPSRRISARETEVQCSTQHMQLNSGEWVRETDTNRRRFDFLWDSKAAPSTQPGSLQTPLLWRRPPAFKRSPTLPLSTCACTHAWAGCCFCCGTPGGTGFRHETRFCCTCRNSCFVTSPSRALHGRHRGKRRPGGAIISEERSCF